MPPSDPGHQTLHLQPTVVVAQVSPGKSTRFPTSPLHERSFKVVSNSLTIEYGHSQQQTNTALNKPLVHS